MAATNADRVPQRTLLPTTTSIRPLSSSAAEDNDTGKEEGSSAPSNIESQTQAAEARKSSSLTSGSHHATCSALSCLATSSSWSASRARSDGGLRIRSQTLELALSRCEHCSSFL
jgi:hypothetical protein